MAEEVKVKDMLKFQQEKTTIEKDAREVVDPPFADAIRRGIRANKIKEETLKVEPTPERELNPRLPKMRNGAKEMRLTLDESLFREVKEEKETEEEKYFRVSYERKNSDIFVPLVIMVKAENEEQAKEKFYKTYDEEEYETIGISEINEVEFKNWRRKGAHLLESLVNDEIDEFFKLCKKLGVETLGDLNRLLTQEPETDVDGTEIEKLRAYAKEINPRGLYLRNEKLEEKRVGKTKQVKVLQGNYGYGWDDLIEYEMDDRTARDDLKDYEENEKEYPHRIIYRRVPNPEYKEEKLEEAHREESDSWEVEELVLYIRNDSEIYDRYTKPTVISLARKLNKGIFDKELAAKAFLYVVDAGVRKYRKEFKAEDGYEQFRFNPATREDAAKKLLDMEMESIEDEAEDLKDNKEFKEAVEDKDYGWEVFALDDSDNTIKRLKKFSKKTNEKAKEDAEQFANELKEKGYKEISVVRYGQEPFIPQEMDKYINSYFKKFKKMPKKYEWRAMLGDTDLIKIDGKLYMFNIESGELVKDSLTEAVEDSKNYVIYKEDSDIMGTNENNYNQRIRNAREIQNFTDAGFKDIDEVVNYMKTYGHVDGEIIIKEAVEDREELTAEEATDHVFEDKGKITILGHNGYLGSDFYFKDGKIITYNFEIGVIVRNLDEYKKEDLLKHLKGLEKNGFKFIKSDNIKDTRDLHINNTYKVESLKHGLTEDYIKETVEDKKVKTKKIKESYRVDPIRTNFDKIFKREDYKENFDELEEILGADELYGGNIEEIKNIRLYQYPEIYKDSVTVKYRYIFDALINGDFYPDDEEKKWIRFDTNKMDKLGEYGFVVGAYYDDYGPISEVEGGYYVGDEYNCVKSINDLLYNAGYDFVDNVEDILTRFIDDPTVDDEEIEESLTEAVEDKKVKFDYAVIERMEGGEEDTESQKELRKAEKEQTKFTDLDALGDLIYKVDKEKEENNGFDKLYVDFYGKADDGKEVRVHIYRVDLGDGLGRENHLTNKDKEEIEEYLTKEYNKLEK